MVLHLTQVLKDEKEGDTQESTVKAGDGDGLDKMSDDDSDVPGDFDFRKCFGVTIEMGQHHLDQLPKRLVEETRMQMMKLRRSTPSYASSPPVL